ncbi:MBL fold metallo-hydrolase [Paracoccaceae bacterium GXU_MW_L88]
MLSQDHSPPIGPPETLAPGIRVVTAPNASPMTFTGTRSYLLGEGAVALIDPGPDLPAHRDALLAALAPGERYAAILVTHAHLDHSPLASRLAAELDLPLLAYGDWQAGRREGLPEIGGGEGVDQAFAPTQTLDHGEVFTIGDLTLTALHTPGHQGNHLCFAVPALDALFSGDVLMGWSTTLISPPDGDLGDFFDSLDLLAGREEAVFYPGHGAPVTNPRENIAWQKTHREERTAQILAVLERGPATPEAITEAVYEGLNPALLPAAKRNVMAHLIWLDRKGDVTADGPLSPSATYRRKN